MFPRKNTQVIHIPDKFKWPPTEEQRLEHMITSLSLLKESLLMCNTFEHETQCYFEMLLFHNINLIVSDKIIRYPYGNGEKLCYYVTTFQIIALGNVFAAIIESALNIWFNQKIKRWSWVGNPCKWFYVHKISKQEFLFNVNPKRKWLRIKIMFKNNTIKLTV